MAVLIDAYNVLHCTHILPDPWGTMSVQGMCELIEKSAYRRDRVVIVCDGTPPGGIPARSDVVRVIYAGGGKDADSVIERLIARADGPRDLIVVSNDNRLKRAARRRRATAMASETFLRKLYASATDPRNAPGASDAKPPEPINVDAWLDEFDLQPGDLDAFEMPGIEADLLESMPGVSDEIKDQLRQPPEPPPEKKNKPRTFDPDAAERRRRAAETAHWLDQFDLTDADLAELENQLEPPAGPPGGADPDTQTDHTPTAPGQKEDRRPPDKSSDTPAGTQYWLREFGFDDEDEQT